MPHMWLQSNEAASSHVIFKSKKESFLEKNKCQFSSLWHQSMNSCVISLYFRYRRVKAGGQRVESLKTLLLSTPCLCTIIKEITRVYFLG